MTDEAEKVINLSLCKMAESRAIRRGGNSLHKHLLIASVLTKARSAYFENWYLGDNDCSSVSSSYSAQQSSSQQGGSPSSQSHNRLGSNLMASSTNSNNGFNGPSSSSLSHPQQSGAEDDQVSINNNHIIDPRFFVEVESEIELPSDILNCVEKLGDIGGDMAFMSHSAQDSLHHHVNRNASASDIIHEVDEIFEESDPTAEMILSDVVVSIDEDIDVTESTSSDYTSLCSPDNSRSTLTYLDLDARPPTPNKSSDSSLYSSSSSALISSASNAVVIQPIILPVPNNNSCLPNNNSSTSSNNNSNSISAVPTNKRRRGWSFDEDEDLYTDEELAQQLPEELNQKLKKNGVSVTNMAKRLRFSGDSSLSSSSSSSSSSGFDAGSESRNDHCQSGEDEHEQSPPSTFTFKPSSFRTKKSHFEELEEEDDAEDESDDDSFLADDLGQGSWCDGKKDDNSSHKNDRRVPSASSSGSCSDEEADSNCMEVDQLTSLVQYISFKHQQQQQQHSQNATCGSASSVTSASSVLGLSDKLGVVVSASSAGGGQLIRSMSSPDLCTRAAAVSSSVSQVNKSNAKDLFSSYSSSHRVLTMTV